MTTALRFTIQSVVAGVVAAALILGGRAMVVQAQSSDASEAPAGESAAPSSVHACDLVLESEAETALGAGATQVSDPGQCTYVAEDQSARAVSVATTPTINGQDGILESAIAQLADALNGEMRTVAVGDEAYAVLSEKVSQITARAGEDVVVLVLTLPSGSPDQQLARLTDLTRAALGRL